MTKNAPALKTVPPVAASIFATTAFAELTLYVNRATAGRFAVARPVTRETHSLVAMSSHRALVNECRRRRRPLLLLL